MLTITLLGTAATMPLPDRALSTAFAACGGHGLLFDCGEGTQAAARRAGVNLMRADAVCLTHYHGDHIFGLPGAAPTDNPRWAPGAGWQRDAAQHPPASPPTAHPVPAARLLPADARHRAAAR